MSAESTDLLKPPRDRTPTVLIWTICAFLASGLFMAMTVLDVIGARDESSAVNTFKAPGEAGSDIINFSDDLLIASIGFGACFIITIICIVLYNRAYYYLSIEGGALALRKSKNGATTSLELSEVSEVIVDREAKAADPTGTAPCELELHAKGKTYVVHAHLPTDAEAARDAILAAQAAN